MHFALCGHSALWFTKLFLKDIFFFPFYPHNIVLKLRLIFLISKQEQNMGFGGVVLG